MEQGKITSVYYNDGGIMCDVRSMRVNTEYEKVALVKTHSSFMQMPEQGQKVTMEKLSDGTRFITNVLAKEQTTPDNMKEGELTIQLDPNTAIAFKEVKDGYNISVEASENANLTAINDLNLQADEDINLKAGRDVNINAEGKVYIQGTAWSEHTHDYDDDGATKTTEPPN